jgi:hypothetical protein
MSRGYQLTEDDAVARGCLVGIAAAVATLAGYTSGLLYGSYTRFLYSGYLF